MKLKDDESGFIMVSKKTNENECIDYLIDTVSNSTISMFYTNNANFLHKIIIVQSNESMVGYTSKYREETKDFDIIWEMSDGSTTDYETFANIPITDVFKHATTPGVEADTDYQIETLKVSIRIADAINKYVDNEFEETSNFMMRGRGWSKFCNFWKKVFKPILVVVAVVVAIIAPPVTPFVVHVIKKVDEKVKKIEEMYGDIKDIDDESIGPKNLYILKTPNNYEDSNWYNENDEILLKSEGDNSRIVFDITDAKIDSFMVKSTIENEKNGYLLINANYNFEYQTVSGKKEPKVDSNNILIPVKSLNKNEDIDLKITKMNNQFGSSDIYIDVYVGNNTFINNEAKTTFRLILKLSSI